MLVYPFVAWTGLMMLGYCAGILFSPQFTAAARKKMLLGTGFGLILLFVLLRFSNLYGDPVPWNKNRSAPSILFFLLSKWLNIHPPCFTSVLRLVPRINCPGELVKKRFTNVMVHLQDGFLLLYPSSLPDPYCGGCFFLPGHSFAEAKNVGERFPFSAANSSEKEMGCWSCMPYGWEWLYSYIRFVKNMTSINRRTRKNGGWVTYNDRINRKITNEQNNTVLACHVIYTHHWRHSKRQVPNRRISNKPWSICLMRYLTGIQPHWKPIAQPTSACMSMARYGIWIHWDPRP